MITRLSKTAHNSIDRFRLPAALMILGIHTAPLSSLSETADFLVTYCLGRIAVPFFLMVTGYFVISPCIRWREGGFYPGSGFFKSLTKTFFLYLLATLLYLPVNLYSGKLSFAAPGSDEGLTFPALLGKGMKAFLFDGTFYHLWYLPASLTGCLLLWLLLKRLPLKTVWLLVSSLYLIGLLGDSWYGLISDFPPACRFYDFLFGLSSYTRNGIFYTPIFLLMGSCLSQKKYSFPQPLFYGILGAGLSLLLMLTEGYITFCLNWQRHNSMYLFLVPCMFFFFQVVLALPGKPSSFKRRLSLWVYLLHPLCILLVRGFGKLTSLTELLVENSLIHYLAVCLCSIPAALGVCLVTAAASRKRIGICQKQAAASPETKERSSHHVPKKPRLD